MVIHTIFQTYYFKNDSFAIANYVWLTNSTLGVDIQRHACISDGDYKHDSIERHAERHQ